MGWPRPSVGLPHRFIVGSLPFGRAPYSPVLQQHTNKAVAVNERYVLASDLVALSIYVFRRSPVVLFYDWFERFGR